MPVPYLHDEDQSVARAHGAVCAPEFLGDDAQGMLRYRGRLDAVRITPPPADARRELVEGMLAIVATGRAPGAQYRSVGCSIKCKTA